MKEETNAINRDWLRSQACRLLHTIHDIFNYFIMFDYHFECLSNLLAVHSIEYVNPSMLAPLLGNICSIME